MTDGVALSARQAELVEVDHAQASERHGGNNVQVCLVGPSTGKRAGVVRRVEAVFNDGYLEYEAEC